MLGRLRKRSKAAESKSKAVDEAFDEGIELTDLRAMLATHRREIRLALGELDRLGCAVDEERPSRVLIPGLDGTLEGGYAWDRDENDRLGELQLSDSEASEASTA